MDMIWYDILIWYDINPEHQTPTFTRSRVQLVSNMLYHQSINQKAKAVWAEVLPGSTVLDQCYNVSTCFRLGRKNNLISAVGTPCRSPCGFSASSVAYWLKASTTYVGKAVWQTMLLVMYCPVLLSDVQFSYVCWKSWSNQVCQHLRWNAVVQVRMAVASLYMAYQSAGLQSCKDVTSVAFPFFWEVVEMGWHWFLLMLVFLFGDLGPQGKTKTNVGFWRCMLC